MSRYFLNIFFGVTKICFKSYSRITAAESVFHPVPCSGCRSEGFHGLRYKSDSASYHLCQVR